MSALLDGQTDGKHYKRLFNIRSTFLHGRKMDDDPILGKDLLLARRLAQRVVNALLKTALAMPDLQSRETYLNKLDGAPRRQTGRPPSPTPLP